MKRSVLSEIRIRAKSEEIIAALIDSDKLKEWWGIDSAFIEKKDGGLYTTTWMRTTEGIKFISSGRIRLYNRLSHLYLEDMIYINSERQVILGPFTIKYDIEQESDYCILKVKQNNIAKDPDLDWYYKAVMDGWPQALMMLKIYLEKKSSS